ncbi:MAG: hypothetical protein K1X79_02905 [Oligoflexia bacterium]|nr:hypothetical protein [Oligoflexia bacterium]
MLLRKTPHGISVRVRQDEHRLVSFNPQTFSDLMSGSRVTMFSRGDEVSFVASIPDCTERFFWQFRLKDPGFEVLAAPLLSTQCQTLMGMLSELRVALNGSL